MKEKAIISNSTLNDIGQAIIAKGGASAPMYPRDMAAAIQAITPQSSEITGKSFDLSTEKGVTKALAAVIRAFGGTVTAGDTTDMQKDSPLKLKKGTSTYVADIYDDTTGIGLDITKETTNN